MALSVSVSDPEQWYTAYEAASIKQQYEILLETLAQPLTPEFIEDIDLGMLLAIMRDALVDRNQLEKAAAMIQALHRQQPELHQAEYPFLDNLLIEYFLYRDEPEQVREGLNQFLLNPVDDIDQTFITLDYLKLYDARDLAIELCKAAYEPIKNSSNAIRGTEMELSNVLLYDQMQQTFEQLQQSEAVDWEAITETAVQYGFPKKAKWLAEIQHNLTTEVEATPAFLAQFKRDREGALRTLAVGFYRYMAERKQVSFICSSAIWKAVAGFLEDRQTPHKKFSQPESYFAFEQDELDRAVTQMIGGLLSMAQAIGVGLLWGVPYVYDFLLAKQIIPEAVHQQAISSSAALKAMFTESYPHRWRFDFVHRWQPPDSISLEDFEAEAAQFATSLEPVEPLSEEPGEGATFTSMVESLKQQLPPEIQESFEKMVEADLEEEDDGEDVPPLVRFREPIADYKPPKKRKSSLQLAAELPEGDRKPPKKFKKKR
jgi:hypothetical protein